MKIDRLVLGAFQTNCYILRTGDSVSDCLIVDTGLEARQLLGFLQKQDLNPTAVVLTHGHVDHTAGLVALRTAFPETKVYIHNLDAEMLTGDPTNLSALSGATFTTDPADVLLKEGDLVNHAGIELQVLHTPGHTPGGISLYAKVEGIVFVVDTLFAESVGRTDFPGGSMTTLVESIKRKLFTLPDDTQVYPGHGPKTTIAHEKKHNPFLNI
ncbi:MAG: MBL fold metallo-hydrolase [Planctomycetota bacterium]|jgi:glyoxylase-like metal-dependent hydrolase (beta-lactamase superfamily II)